MSTALRIAAPSSDAPQTTPEPAALLLSAVDVARLLALSVRSVERLHSAGRLPAPVRIGRSVRWRRADLDAWIAAGCPPRDRAGRGRDAT